MKQFFVLFVVAVCTLTDAATFTVINTNLTGAGSLREAISNVNATAGAPHMIDFNIPGPGFAITPTNAFPTITNSVIIDGYSQPGTSSNTLANGDNAVLLIEIDGTNAGTTAGITISAGNSTVRGLVINRFNSGGGLAGIRLLTHGNNLIEGNFIGTDPTGLLDRGNTGDGISISSGSATNTIGGTSPGARNIIAGNGGVGINLVVGAAGHNVVAGNFIGVDATGTNALGNSNFGVAMQTVFNTIGGTTTGAGNVISGNASGISINSSDNLIEGNLIGTDATGTKALKNASGGVTVGSSNNVVGGTTVAARNIISGNGGIGVSLNGKNNLVQGNFIGTDITGTIALSNTTFGVSFGGSSNTVGGITATPGTPPGNVISGNGSFAGITLNAVQGNIIQGNLIGTDATGTSALGNNGAGILVQNGSAGTIIGGPAAGAGNVISANTGEGVNITASSGFKSDGCVVQGNWIGTDIDGLLDLGNGGIGVHILGGTSADNITIGAAAGNVIAFNGGAGIVIATGTNDLISANAIFFNNGLGIDLTPTGVTSNDNCDADTGSNRLQNFPVLTLATNAANGLRIDGTLNSTANTTFTLEFFFNDTCDPSGFGEGEEHIGSTNVTTGGGCNANFSVVLEDIFLFTCDSVTATATDPNNNTSEFSACVTVQGDPPDIICELDPPVATNLVGVVHIVESFLTRDGFPAVGVPIFFHVTAGPNAGLSAVVTNDIDGLADFSYTSTTNGTDTITATGRVCAVDFSCSATKVWIFTPNIPPVANCQNVTKNANASCQATVLATEVDNGSMDPDGNITNRVISPAGPFTVGNTPVTLTVFDNRGATASCTATVTVFDVTAPTISCHANINSNLAAGVTNTVVHFGAPTASDNCSGLITNCIPASGSTFDLGTSTVTCTAIDTGGNTNTCTFNVIVTEAAPNQPPVASCQNITVPAGAGCTTNVPASAVDNGSSDPDGSIISRTLSPPGPYAKGTNSVMLTVVDNQGASNSCSATITVVDTSLPAITCSGNITTNLPVGVTNVVINFSAPGTSDNCGLMSLGCTPGSGSNFGVGTNVVTCTAVDSSGNTNGCAFQVIVTSNQPPVAQCNNAIASVNASCQTTVPALAVDAGSFDPDGSIASRSLSPPGPYSLGTNSVMLTVVDNQGASNSCSALVIVVDSTPPTMGTCANITTNLPAGVTNAVVTFNAPIASDNCGVASVISVPASGSTFALGTNTVVTTVTDTSGNTNSCSFNVIVLETPPEVHDLALIKMKAPKNINLKGAAPSLTKFVKVTLQNRSPHNETITNFNGLVTLVAESLGTNCPNATVVLHPGPPNNPKTLKPKQKMAVTFDVTWNCANDPLKGAGHEDFRYLASVHHEAIDGNADTHPEDDGCPRAALPGGVDPNPDPDKPLKDTGCAGGVDVKTDVFIK